MSILDKFMPRQSGVRDPRDPKKLNGMFINWPRYLKFGGARGTGMRLDQSGTHDPKFRAGDKDATRPISDRGRGR